MDTVVQLFRPKYRVDECLDALRPVLESGWTGAGPKCLEFEKDWCEYVGSKNSHFVNSATAALHIATRLLDLPKGSKIATTPLTFVSSNAVIVYEGHVPVFCDVGESLSLDFDSVVRAIKTKGAKAVMWVHYGGSVSPDFYKLMDWIAEEKNGSIPVIEDCAHAAGAFYADGTRVGSRKDTIACFSFHSVKNLPIFDGGMICCPVKEQDERARRLSWLGIDKSTFARTNNDSNELYKWSYNVPELGWKYNANDIAATIGLVQLKCLDSDNAWRNALYERYFSLLRTKSNIRVVTHKDGSSHHLMVLGVNRRDSVIAALKANKFAPGMHYLPNYLFPAFQDYDHEDCERTERYAGRIVSLPNHLDVTYEDVAKVCEVILNVQS